MIITNRCYKWLPQGYTERPHQNYSSTKSCTTVLYCFWYKITLAFYSWTSLVPVHHLVHGCFGGCVIYGFCSSPSPLRPSVRTPTSSLVSRRRTILLKVRGSAHRRGSSLTVQNFKWSVGIGLRDELLFSELISEMRKCEPSLNSIIRLCLCRKHVPPPAIFTL